MGQLALVLIIVVGIHSIADLIIEPRQVRDLHDVVFRTALKIQQNYVLNSVLPWSISTYSTRLISL